MIDNVPKSEISKKLRKEVYEERLYLYSPCNSKRRRRCIELRDILDKNPKQSVWLNTAKKRARLDDA